MHLAVQLFLMPCQQCQQALPAPWAMPPGCPQPQGSHRAHCPAPGPRSYRWARCPPQQPQRLPCTGQSQSTSSVPPSSFPSRRCTPTSPSLLICQSLCKSPAHFATHPRPSFPPSPVPRGTPLAGGLQALALCAQSPSVSEKPGPRWRWWQLPSGADAAPVDLVPLVPKPRQALLTHSPAFPGH